MIKELFERLRNNYEFSPLKGLIVPLALLVIIAMAMVWFFSNAFNAAVRTTCKYQYFIFSPGKFSAGTAIVFCKLADGRIVSGYRTAPWVPPAIDAEMEIDIPQ